MSTPGTASVIRADARALPLASASVDLIVTSPPYYALRSYTDNGEHYAGQIGAEPTPAEYVASLIECTREWTRVLKPTGSIWVNLGDKYAQNIERSRNGHSGTLAGTNPLRSGAVYSGRRDNGVPRKSLIGLPWRFALRCIDDLGLILRAEVIWSKPNGLPESVTDRVRRSHEHWFHFTVQPRYFSAVDTIREQSTSGAHGAARSARRDKRADDAARWSGRHEATGYRNDRNHKAMSALGKLPGSVWEIATQPLKVPPELGVDHFAAFPMEWPRRIILGWSPSGICVECGEGRRPSVYRGESSWQRRRADGDPMRYGMMGTAAPLGRSLSDPVDRAAGGFGKPADRVIVGESCACPEPTAPTLPAVVLDPFGGTGTAALSAKALGRHGISVDMSADYCRLARWRTTDPGQLARAMRVKKPPVVAAGQPDLLDLMDWRD